MSNRTNQHTNSQFDGRDPGGEQQQEQVNERDNGRVTAGQFALGQGQVQQGQSFWGNFAHDNANQQGGQLQQLFQNAGMNLPQHLAMQLSALGGQQGGGLGSYSSNTNTGDSSNQLGDFLTQQQTFNSQLPFNSLQLLGGLQQLSSVLGLQQSLGTQQAVRQYDQVPQMGVLIDPNLALNTLTRNDTSTASAPSPAQPDSMAHAQEQKLDDGSTTVPCRARGLTKDHNAKNAFLIIPKDAKHGEGLRCSHVQCQNKGIRFVYCTVCKVPVAKVNFSTRHKHEEVLGDRESSDQSEAQEKPAGAKLDSDGGDDDDADSDYHHDTADKVMQQSEDPRDKNPSQHTTTRHPARPKVDEQHSSRQLKRRATDTAMLQEDFFGSDKGSDMNIKGRRKHRRMSSPTFSDSDEPTGGRQEKRRLATSTARKESSSKRKMKKDERRWLNLLHSRPPTHEKEQMKTWLAQVVIFSEPGTAGGTSAVVAPPRSLELTRMVEEGIETAMARDERGHPVISSERTSSSGKGGGSSGNAGASSPGNEGTSSSGNGGTSSSGNRATTSSGNGGTSSSGNRGTTSSGNGGTSSSGNGGTSSSGNGGTSSFDKGDENKNSMETSSPDDITTSGEDAD